MDKGFLVASDEKLSDILFWWIGQCQRFHPGVTIQVVDFGLSPSSLNRVEQSGSLLLSVKPIKGKNPWFSKPEAMLASKTDVTLWMDVDTEFVRNVSDIFDLVQEDKLGLVNDQYRYSTGEPQFNTGVVLYRGKPKILSLWNKNCKHTTERGDQEVLLEMLTSDPTLNESIFTLPDKYNYVRLAYMLNASGAGDLRVVHWTGPKGKSIIRGPKIMGAIAPVRGSYELTHGFTGELNQHSKGLT